MKRRPLTDAPEALEPEQRERIRKWAKTKYPFLHSFLGRHWAECRDWHRANGVLRYDWEAAFRSWIRLVPKFEQKRSLRKSDVERMADVIPLFRSEK